MAIAIHLPRKTPWVLVSPQNNQMLRFSLPRWENPNVKMSSLQAYQVPILALVGPRGWGMCFSPILPLEKAWFVFFVDPNKNGWWTFKSYFPLARSGAYVIFPSFFSGKCHQNGSKWWIFDGYVTLPECMSQLWFVFFSFFQSIKVWKYESFVQWLRSVIGYSSFYIRMLNPSQQWEMKEKRFYKVHLQKKCSNHPGVLIGWGNSHPKRHTSPDRNFFRELSWQGAFCLAWWPSFGSELPRDLGWKESSWREASPATKWASQTIQYI